MQYSASSQDELTIINMCRDVGYGKFMKRNPSTITIILNDKKEKYNILKTIEFTSKRKCMSLIVQNKETQKAYIFTKGADVEVTEKLSLDNYAEGIIESCDEFSTAGLRTLLFAYRELSLDEINKLSDLSD